MIVRWPTFGGEIPKLEPDALPETAAQLTSHVDLNRGGIRPLHFMGSVATLSNAVKSLYTTDGLRFLSWTTDVDAVRGPIIEDQLHRIYFTDPSGYWVTFEDQQRTNGGPPANKYRVGVPRPPAKPVLSLTTGQVDLVLTAKFFYEAAGVKYQEQTITLTPITAGTKYYFTPPAKNVVGGGTVTNPGSLSEGVQITSFIFRDGSIVTGYDAGTWQAIGPSSMMFSGGGIVSDVVAFTDANGLRHEVADLWTLTRYSTVVDPSVGSTTTTTDPGATAPNASQTPQGYTPDNAMPQVWISAKRADGTVLYEAYSAGSSFNTSAPAATITLAADPTVTSRMNVTIEYSGSTTGTGGAVLTETRAYVYTWVNSLGEESAPSDPAIITVNVFQNVQVVLTPNPQADYAPIVKAYVYRTATGSNGTTEYFLAFTAPVASGYVWTDTTKSSELSTDVPESWEWDLPPADLRGLTYIGNGMLAGISGTSVYICEPYRPHAWPKSYIKQHSYVPIRLMPFQNSVLVTTDGYPYMMTGSTPDGIVQQRLAADQGAVSKWAHADLGGMIAYATNDGIALVRGGQVSIEESLSLFGRDKWRELYNGMLHLMRFAAHDGQLLVFWEGAPAGKQFLVRFDERTGTLVHHDFAISASFVLPETDALYTAYGNTVYAFDAGVRSLGLWQSRDVLLAKPRNMGALQLLLDGADVGGVGPVHAELYADGVKVAEGNFRDGDILRTPTDVIARRWSVKLLLQATAVVKAMYLAGTVQELQQV